MRAFEVFSFNVFCTYVNCVTDYPCIQYALCICDVFVCCCICEHYSRVCCVICTVCIIFDVVVCVCVCVFMFVHVHVHVGLCMHICVCTCLFLCSCMPPFLQQQ